MYDYIYIRIILVRNLLRELAYAIVEAKKHHDLQPASWRTRKAGGVIQSEFKGSRFRSTYVLGQEKMTIQANKEKDLIHFFPAFFFFLFSLHCVRWCPLTMMRDNLLSKAYWSIDSNANCFWKNAQDIPRNNVLLATWEFLSPVKLAHKINYRTLWGGVSRLVENTW